MTPEPNLIENCSYSSKRPGHPMNKTPGLRKKQFGVVGGKNVPSVEVGGQVGCKQGKTWSGWSLKYTILEAGRWDIKAEVS